MYYINIIDNRLSTVLAVWLVSAHTFLVFEADIYSCRVVKRYWVVFDIPSNNEP